MDDSLEMKLVEIWEGLTDEQRAKARKCKSPGELITLVQEEGIVLPDEVFDAVAGGYIYHGPSSWFVIHDDCGYDDGKQFPTAEAARAAATSQGQSVEEINWDKIQKLRKAYEKKQGRSRGC